MTTAHSGTGPSRPAHESFVRILLNDVAGAMERHRFSDSQSTRRNLVRTIFAAIEGLAWSYRQHITSTAAEMDALSRDEEIALSETTHLISDTGKVTKQTRFTPLPSIIRLTTRIAVRLAPELDIKLDTSGWEKFRKAIAIRNRITHPKVKADLIIALEDVETCMKACFWLMETSAQAMQAVNEAFAGYVAELRSLLAGLTSGDPAILAEYRAAGES